MWLLLLCCAREQSFSAPALPVIPTNTFNITNYGAVSSETLTNTAAISSPISAANAAGGGIAEISPGTYLSGNFSLKSKINLQIDAGATLKMLPYGSFPSGATELITANSLDNIELSGGGVIEGQGSPWWAAKPSTRPVLLAISSCRTVLVQNVTFQNSPKMHITVKGTDSNITIQGVTINSPDGSPNTDGIDLIGTTCLVQNCTINAGDDNIALGSTGGTANDITITNCAFGTGHGLSIGSNTRGGVSNLTVINCSFNGTQYGIRMKSDNAVSSGGAGGLAQNLFYYNLTMTNISRGPIVIYSYYNEYGTPTSISPATAYAQPLAAVTTSTPVWRNIVISNLWANVTGAGIAGIIWGRTELPVTNITLKNVTISAAASFDLYNVKGLTIEDSQFNVSGDAKTFSLYNAAAAITNTTIGSSAVSFDGIAGTNSVALYDIKAVMSDASAIGCNPITIASSTLSNSTGLTLDAGTAINFGLGTNPCSIYTSGNLSLHGTLNIFDGGGIGPGTYTLLNFTGSFSGNPTLGMSPAGLIASLNTTQTGQVRLLVQSVVTSPPAFTNISRAGSNLILSGTGAPPSSAFTVLSSTNLLEPISNWNPVATTYSTASGSFQVTTR